MSECVCARVRVCVGVGFVTFTSTKEHLLNMFCLLSSPLLLLLLSFSSPSPLLLHLCVECVDYVSGSVPDRCIQV
jgi:hypothetical protein